MNAISLGKNYTLSLYEKAMPPNLSWEEKLSAAKSAGFDAVEISIDETGEKLNRLCDIAGCAAEILRARQKTGIPVLTMCLSGHRKYPLGSLNHSTALRALDIMERSVALALAAGIRIIQLAGYDVYYEPSNDETRRRFAENLKKCVSMASKEGVMLAFETMENDFMNTIQKAMYYVNLINSPYLQVYPDIGNISNSGADPAADIAAGRGHIAAVHLKETKKGVFRDLYYGEGEVDFSALTTALKKQGVRLYNAEFWYCDQRDWQKELKNANAFLRKYLD